MINDRSLLRFIIAALAMLIVLQVVGSGMLAHWQAQDEKLSQPDPAVGRLLADQGR